MRIYKLKVAESLFLFTKGSCIKRNNESDLHLVQLNLDFESFVSYIRQNLLPDWELVNELGNSQVPYRINPKIKELLPKTVLVIAKHYDFKKSTIVDAYQIFIWIEGKGIGMTEIFKTELHHPIRPESNLLDLQFDANIKSLTDDFIILDISANNYVQPWGKSEELLFGWYR